MARRLWLSFSLLILCLHIQAKGIKAVVSHTIFYLPDSIQHHAAPYVEASWEISPVSLHYTKIEDGRYIAKFKTDLVFTNEANDTVKQDHDVLQTRPNANAAEISAQRIIDLRRYTLPLGKTTMQLFLTDLVDSTNRLVFKDTFTVQAPGAKPFYSEIELLDTFYSSAANTAFQKNNRQQVPLSTNFYDEKKSVLHYYVELYNTQSVPKEEQPLIQHIFISKKENDQVIDKLQRKDTLQSNLILPTIGDMDISTLGSGNYYLNVALINSLHKIIAGKVVFFQRYNNNPVLPKTDTASGKARTIAEIEDVTLLDLNKTFVAKFTFAQIRAILKMLIPVSDPTAVQNIQSFLKKPDETYMRYFIYNHFSYINKKDPEAAWRDYAEKIREINKLFGSAQLPGYETDRGMTYLKYGKPDERVTVQNEQGTYPYEIWQYNSLHQAVTGKNISNAIFLFYKPAEQVGNYILLHSTVPGETQNLQWRSFLYTSNNTDNNVNSRAEQYLPNALH